MLFVLRPLTYVAEKPREGHAGLLLGVKNAKVPCYVLWKDVTDLSTISSDPTISLSESTILTLNLDPLCQTNMSDRNSQLCIGLDPCRGSDQT